MRALKLPPAIPRRSLEIEVDRYCSAEDDAWTSDLLGQFEKTRALRPWDMTIACLDLSVEAA